MLKARIGNPGMAIPDAMPTLMALGKLAENSSLPPEIAALAHLRASQINGCSVCIDLAWRFKKTKESEERLFMVAAWRDAPCFSDAERAALALTECVTRLSDRADPVPDAVWDEAARHFEPSQLAALVFSIATTNLWNRINVATRQVAGEWAKSVAAGKGGWKPADDKAV